MAAKPHHSQNTNRQCDFVAFSSAVAARRCCCCCCFFACKSCRWRSRFTKQFDCFHSTVRDVASKQSTNGTKTSTPKTSLGQNFGKKKKVRAYYYVMNTKVVHRCCCCCCALQLPIFFTWYALHIVFLSFVQLYIFFSFCVYAFFSFVAIACNAKNIRLIFHVASRLYADDDGDV